jgi:hypothetical protein
VRTENRKGTDGQQIAAVFIESAEGRKTIQQTSLSGNGEQPENESRAYFLIQAQEDLGPRLAKALAHAIQLCGGTVTKEPF